MSLKVIVVGAGIAGSACAIGFARHGHHVVVYEREAAERVERGNGIQLQPNALRVLQAWGLQEDVEQASNLSGVTKMRRYDSGEVVARVPNQGQK